jgi:hypothetical protein
MRRCAAIEVAIEDKRLDRDLDPQHHSSLVALAVWIASPWISVAWLYGTLVDVP